MKAEIITIGDEILIGQIVDTNSAFMGQLLNDCGIEVYQITSVHDNQEHIIEALNNAKNNANIVLITGGLGPTKDDITKKVLCKFFDCKTHYHMPTMQAIEERLSKRAIPMTQLNKDQALVPDACTILANSEGTAPGMWFEKDDVIFVSMPGVPYEMKSIMENQVIPRLLTLNEKKAILHQTIMVYGIAESILSDMLNDWEDNLPKNIKLAYLPNQLMIRLRLSAYGTEKQELQKQIKLEVEKLKIIIPNNIFAFSDEKLGAIIGRLIADKNKTIAVAESCTGGSLAYAFTSNSGASEYFKGGIVAYSNKIKEQMLGVNSNTLNKFGAVSNQTATEMAQGVIKLMDADYSIATTGIAGPSGGTKQKPVGTVCIAVADKNRVIVKEYQFNREREHNIERTIQTALHMLKALIN